MPELEEYRGRIDAIDRELVQLFLKRMEVTGKVGEYKKERGIPVLDAARERRVIAAKARATDDPLRKADLAELYATVMAISRRQQRLLVREGLEDPGYAAWVDAMAHARAPVADPKVIYQGEPGAYSESAAIGFFGENVKAVGLPWFSDVFAALDRGRRTMPCCPSRTAPPAPSGRSMT